MNRDQPKLIKGLQAEYKPSTYPGHNASGLKVYGKNVLVGVDECSEVTSGGVHVPQNILEIQTANATTGCIYYIGPEAFRRFDDGTLWTGDMPKVGDRICFEKYAGQLQQGVDEKPYRIMDYRCIAGGPDLEYLESIGVEHAPQAIAS